MSEDLCASDNKTHKRCIEHSNALLTCVATTPLCHMISVSRLINLSIKSGIGTDVRDLFEFPPSLI